MRNERKGSRAARVDLRKPGLEVLGVLAAGPLEDLIKEAGRAVIDRLETIAARDRIFRLMLSRTWLWRVPDDLYQRVFRAAGAPEMMRFMHEK